MSDDKETHDDTGGADRPASARDVAHLFVVLEADRPLAGGARYSLAGLDQVLLGRGSERRATRSEDDGVGTLRLELPGKSLSSVHARLLRTSAGWVVEDAGSRNGTFVGGARVDRAGLGSTGWFEAGRVSFMLGHAAPADDLEASSADDLTTLVPGFGAKIAAVRQVATSSLFVLLEGETGSGKEVFARAIHALSRRPGKFVPVNCGGLAEGVLASTLFGHRRGAFSGAVTDERGLVRESDQGTLFLDEIGELPKGSQAALLRVLQDGEVFPVGGTKATHVDLRVVAATNRSLSDEVAKGGFRADLFARLSAYPFRIPALRDRRVDMGLLVSSILADLAQGRPVTLTSRFARHLLAHAFPFNVRELRQTLGAALVLSTDGALDAPASADEPAPIASTAPKEGLSPEELRLRSGLLAAMREHRGNVAAVARAMGKAPMQIHRWAKRFGVDPDEFR